MCLCPPLLSAVGISIDTQGKACFSASLYFGWVAYLRTTYFTLRKCLISPIPPPLTTNVCTYSNEVARDGPSCGIYSAFPLNQTALPCAWALRLHRCMTRIPMEDKSPRYSTHRSIATTPLATPQIMVAFIPPPPSPENALSWECGNAWTATKRQP